MNAFFTEFIHKFYQINKRTAKSIKSPDNEGVAFTELS
ncbi:hypothetical protein Agau_C100509 [Agrobacterium tumefaciens F2]|nr:hypothetical protein Agau_C100509 [Agrobacterium tumefaciens F2]